MAREHWSGRVAFVAAAAGSAVGLGNLWKFPYITGVNGGGAFVLVYLACIALVGMPIFMAELWIGVKGQKNVVESFEAVDRPRSPWRLVGWMGLLAAVLILSFYGVVGGWVLDFAWRSVSGGLAGPGAGGAFGELQASPWRQIGMQFLFMGATVGVVMGGVKAGLERLNKVLMPALALMLVGLLIYSVRLDGFRESAAFMFSFKAEKLTWGGVLEAVGHAFFTLSLGMGAIITYGSYLGTDRGLVRTTVAVCAVDTLVALTAGVVIFAVVFSHAGMEPSAGPGLMFATLPTLMADLPGARAVASVFFLLVLFAALTSAISLLEVAVAYWDEKHGTRRGPTALVIGLVVTAAGVPSALSTNVLADVTVAGLTFLDVVDKLTSQYVLPIGGMLTALFLGWVLGPRAVRAIVGEGREFFAQGLLWCCRVVAPAAVLVIVAQTVWEDVRPAPAAEVVPAEPEGAAAPAEGGGAGGE